MQPFNGQSCETGKERGEHDPLQHAIVSSRMSGKRFFWLFYNTQRGRLRMAGGIPKARLMDGDAMQRVLTRMAHEMMEQLDPMSDVILVGIRRRGVPLAHRLADIIEKYSDNHIRVPVGELDITMYRDDLDPDVQYPAINACDLPVDVTGKTVVLVDDVIYTGRSVRAALDAILDKGRAAKIRLAVLIDRGHRELPIRADFVGKNVPTAANERIGVQVTEIDGGDGVALYSRS